MTSTTASAAIRLAQIQNHLSGRALAGSAWFPDHRARRVCEIRHEQLPDAAANIVRRSLPTRFSFLSR